MATKSKFATGTIVAPEKTLEEIKHLVTKVYKANKFAFGEEETQIAIAFEMRSRRVRFVMPLPTRDEAKAYVNQFDRQGRYSESKHQQLIRSRWRSLLLTIKAKLESVESGIETFEEAFLAQIVLPNQQTVSEWLQPQIAAAYDGGKMPPLLGSGG